MQKASPLTDKQLRLAQVYNEIRSSYDGFEFKDKIHFRCKVRYDPLYLLYYLLLLRSCTMKYNYILD